MCHRTRALLAALAIALALTGGAQPAAAQDRLTLLLDWFVNPDHGPLVVARERGDFARAGVDVELIAPADPNDPPKLVAAGKADVAVSYQPQLHLQAAQGLPLVRIGTLVATPLNCLVVAADGPIKTLADLEGRKVGFSVGGFEDALLGAMLENAGLTPADVTLINVNFALSQALAAGRVDAVIGAFRNFELTQLELVGVRGRAFFPEDEGVPPYDELVLVAHRDRIADPRLRTFIDGVEKGVLAVINRPEESWRLFVRAHPQLDDPLNRRAWADTLPRFAHSPAALDRRRYQRFARFLAGRGLIAQVPPLEQYAVELP
jgi:putative hydroxymethylpyrimidine transport system substrate-binding protein